MPSDFDPPPTVPYELVGSLLVSWFRGAQRDLPWRRGPDAYAVWVSELMLQQTQVATVVPYFERWMQRFPTIAALAAADEQDVLHAWQGLGYYSRARNLLNGARTVMAEHGGTVPPEPEVLRRLPGVGPYTAGAIASIAYNVAAPIVDGNVVRVLSRLFALRGDPAREPLRRQIWELAEALIPAGQAREFNPAMMELGATVCTPARPRCAACPLAEHCRARREGLQETLPETAARPKATAVRNAAAVVREEAGRVLLAQRPRDAERWPGMWEFPTGECLEGESAEHVAARAVWDAAGVTVRVGPRLVVLRHTVTRYRITLEAFSCVPDRDGGRGVSAWTWRWATLSELVSFPLPAAQRLIAARLEQGGGEEGELDFDG
jgi:A/G-specific adenine glycosylase